MVIKMDKLMEVVLAFRNERNWKQFHNSKDLAISISIEAAELLELFQWSAEDTVVEEKHSQMKEELADVMIYSMLMADSMGVNLEEIIYDKIKKNGKKYEVQKAYGSKEKYTEFGT